MAWVNKNSAPPKRLSNQPMTTKKCLLSIAFSADGKFYAEVY